MATSTLGTNGTTTLTSLNFATSAADADIATITLAILNDTLVGTVATPYQVGAFSKMGLLYVPNRGVLKVLPGDYVGVDATGWPILVSKAAILGTVNGSTGLTSWTHT